MKRRKIIALAMAMTATILAQSVLGFADAKAETKSESAIFGNVGNKGAVKAKNFTLTDVNGKTITLESLKGKTVILNFWATWCPYCIEEMPDLQNLEKKYGKKGLAILTVNVEDTETAKAFLEENGFTFRTAIDTDFNVSEMYEVEVLPTTFIINKEGTIVNKLEGAHTEKEFLRHLKAAGFKVKKK